MAGARRGGAGAPPPPPRTKWTRRVPHPVLIGHAALTPEQEGVAEMEEQRCALELTCRLNAAACLLRLGRGAGAVDECSRALRLGGGKRDEALCFRRRARAHLLLGELDAARADCRSLRAVLAAAPDEAETAELTRLEARIGAPRCPVRNIGEGTGLLAGTRGSQSAVPVTRPACPAPAGTAERALTAKRKKVFSAMFESPGTTACASVPGARHALRAHWV